MSKQGTDEHKQVGNVQSKVRQWLDCGFLLVWSWLVMTLLHELGHIIVGCSAGGDLRDFELRPWCLPHSFFASNPAPLFTLWAGPVLGCFVPLATASLLKRPAVWFVAWFCVTANGIYLLLGYYSGDNELDSYKILQMGTPDWILVAVGSAMTLAGYTGFRTEFQRRIDQSVLPIAGRTLAISASGMILWILMLGLLGAG
jgi:hypothetical protein